MCHQLLAVGDEGRPPPGEQGQEVRWQRRGVQTDRSAELPSRLRPQQLGAVDPTRSPRASAITPWFGRPLPTASQLPWSAVK